MSLIGWSHHHRETQEQMSSFDYFSPISKRPNSLNAGAVPYIPKNQISQKKPIHSKRKHKRTPCPSFAYYLKINSPHIYNAVSHCCNRQIDEKSESSSTASLDISLSSTPIPCSVASSFQSQCDLNVDVHNIEPYVPTNKPDIDLISRTYADDEPVHPAIAALTEQESIEMLNAPIWNVQNDEETKQNDVRFSSKIAIEEDDYQYLYHPNKKPTKYGYASSAKSSKIAKDDTFVYPPHIQYLQQSQYSGSYHIHGLIY